MGDVISLGRDSIYRRRLTADTYKVDLSWFVRRLRHHAIHELVGLSADAYAALWPRTVVIPGPVANAYHRPLLVDRTVGIEQLAARCHLESRLPFALGDLPDLAPPIHAGRPLTRYVAFVCYEDARDERRLLPEFDDHLALAEALWLPLLHPAHAGGSQKRTALSTPPLPDGRYAVLAWGGRRGAYLTSIKTEAWRETSGLALRAHFVVPVS